MWGEASSQLQVFPQNVPTSCTHCASHSVSQQYGSMSQMVATQLGMTGGLSQPDTSATPVLQAECVHEPELTGHAKLLQREFTCETHVVSHAVLQQKGSAAQMAATQVSHVGASGGPTVHRPREQAVEQVIGAAFTSASREPTCFGLAVS